MNQFDASLVADFDGHPVSDVDDVIHDALDDPRHRERMPGLAGPLNDDSAVARERFLACVALTTWAELAGFDAVVAAARDPERAPWYDILIDRKSSVDNTFAQLSLAVGDSDDLALEKDTWEQRTEAFWALVRIADTDTSRDAEPDHRRHAVVEQVNADIKNSTFVHAPSGHFQANAAWLTLAALAHNLTRATDRPTRSAQPARRGPRRVDMWKSWADQRRLPAQTTDQPPDTRTTPERSLLNQAGGSGLSGCRALAVAPFRRVSITTVRRTIVM